MFFWDVYNNCNTEDKKESGEELLSTNKHFIIEQTHHWDSSQASVTIRFLGYMKAIKEQRYGFNKLWKSSSEDRPTESFLTFQTYPNISSLIAFPRNQS